MMMFAVATRLGWWNFKGGESFQLAPECLTTYEALAREAARFKGATVVAFELKEVKRYEVGRESVLPQLGLKLGAADEGR